MDEFDKLDEVENGGLLDNELSLSHIYSVRKGGFGINDNIRTFVTTLTVEQLSDDISYYETLSQDKEWPVSQIIQREIDVDRADAITKKYLLGRGRAVKYFPPIIIALLPRTVSGDFKSSYIYEKLNDPLLKEKIFQKSKYAANPKFKEILLSKNDLSLVEGLFEFNISSVFEHNIFCWDKSKFYAVVIDGQHRLYSLCKSAELEPTFKSAKQDVVFVDVSPLVKEIKTLSPIEVLRTIFIDINTNAKSVSLVRRILMDDKDLSSLCVQSLVESVNGDGSSKDKDSFLPSFLVDWYGESSKHELPHLTGLLTLHQIISDELVPKKIASIEDHRDQKKINNFVQNINSDFFVDDLIEKEIEFADITPLKVSFNEYLSEQEINREVFFNSEVDSEGLGTVIFTYDYRVLEIAKSSFEKFYAKSICNIFLNLSPYKRLIEALEAERVNDHTSVNYHLMLMHTKKIAKSLPNKTAYVKLKKLLQERLSHLSLMYTVVGQKALFKFFFENLKDTFKQGSTPKTVENCATSFIENFNATFSTILSKENDFFSNKFEIPINQTDPISDYSSISGSFWEGVLFENGRIIYNSQGVRAFSDIMRLLVELQTCKEAGGDFESIISQSQIRFAVGRTKRMLAKNFGDKPDFTELAEKIILHKKKFLVSIFQ
jgi:hypothetical protein